MFDCKVIEFILFQLTVHNSHYTQNMKGIMQGLAKRLKARIKENCEDYTDQQN